MPLPGHAGSRAIGPPNSFLVPGMVALLLSMPAGCARAGTSEAEGGSTGPHPEYAVYALSRGRGVPQETQDAHRRIQEMLEEAREESDVVRLEASRIGLEGERRVCAVLRDREAAREIIGRVRAVARDVELIDVVEEPCSVP